MPLSKGVDPRLVAELTESQKVCLRLVRRGRTSKQIARETGLSDKTVDQYMSRAASLLAVANRYAAAELLEMAENGTIKVPELSSEAIESKRRVGATLVSPDEAENETDAASPATSERSGGSNGSAIDIIFRLPPVGGRRHEYEWTQRTTTILRIAFAAVVSIAALIAIVRGAIVLLKP